MTNLMYHPTDNIGRVVAPSAAAAADPATDQQGLDALREMVGRVDVIGAVRPAGHISVYFATPSFARDGKRDLYDRVASGRTQTEAIIRALRWIASDLSVGRGINGRTTLAMLLDKYVPRMKAAAAAHALTPPK